MEQQLYASEITPGGHGEKYQKEIALALWLLMRESSSTTRMAYEMTVADKFDDVVLFDDTNEKIHLIQAKHADTKDEQVKFFELDALFPTGNSDKGKGDFDLYKYAKSYFCVTRSLKERAYNKMFYIFTNKVLKLTDNDWVKIEEREENEILRISGSSAKNLKLMPTEKAITELCNYINKDDDITAIKDAVKEFFHSGKVSQTFTRYCTPLKDVMIINENKCRFASNFNAENPNPDVVRLYKMLQSDQVDMEEEVTVNKKFQTKESRNKFLPPRVDEDDIRNFFRDFTLSVGQPNDLRPIIVAELKAWMKTWIQPEIFGQLKEKYWEQVYIDLGAYFDACNKPVGEKSKRVLGDYFDECNKPVDEKSLRSLMKLDIEKCFEQIKREMQTGGKKREMAEAEEWKLTYINRHLKYEEAALEQTGGMLSIDQKMSGNDKVAHNNRSSSIVRTISDTKFVEELRGKFKSQQHILLVADPGMGKTSLLQFLSFEAQKKNHSAVFLMRLSTLCKKLDEIEKVSNINDVREILSAVLSETNCNLILNAPESRNDEGYSIILALDAFDEIHSKYTEKVISILELLSLKKSIQFIISSRLHVQEILQSKFDFKLILLVPFQDEDQIRYLKKIWMKKSVDEKVVEDFSELLFEKYHSGTLSNSSEMFGLPLMMRMLAEVYSDRFKQFVSAANSDKTEPLDWPEDILNIGQLLERFVHKCFHIKFEEKFKTKVDINDAEFNSFIAVYILEHQLLAIKLLEIEMLMDIFTKPKNKKIYDLFKIRYEKGSEKSMLVTVVNNDVQFCHLSFGEYFVATYLSDNISELEPNILIKVLSQREVIRKLTLIKLEENENCSETLNELCRLNWDVALWACESGCLKLVSFLNLKSFSTDQLSNMLKVSAKCGYLAICELLIGYNANLDKSTALHSAVENGHFSVVKQLIENNADPNDMDEYNRTALHVASYKENMEIIQLLIDKGGNLNSKTIFGQTPLHLAVLNNHESVVKNLIANSADPNEMDDNKWTALHYACQNGNVETVKFLVEQYSNISSQTIFGQTPLHIAALNGHAHVVELLIAKNADPDKVDDKQWTALHMACQNGNVETVKLFIKKLENTNFQTIFGETPLHIAALNGHASVVEVLLANNADPDKVDDKKWTALHYACQNGNVEIVKFLIDKGSNTNSQTIIGQTPLHIAALNVHTRVVELLIANNADPDKVDRKKWTALYYACQNGNVEMVKFLIDKGSNTNSQTIFGQTPLHIAALNGHASVVEVLLANNADPEKVDDKQWTALHYACQNGNVEIVKFLIDKGSNTNSQTILGRTPLHIAALNDHASVVELLIANNADPDKVDRKKWTALHKACRNGNVETVKFLIRQGSNTNSQTFSGETPLHIAALNGHASVVEVLLANNADPDKVDDKKWTALHYACQNGNVEMVKFLIDKGSNTNSKTFSGETPLHIAALNGHASVVEVLLANNADPDKVDDKKWTALHYACQNGNVEIVKFLIDKGSNTSSQTISGETPLHIAAENGHAMVIELLIANNGDPDKVDNKKWTALHYACRNGNIETVTLLIDRGSNTNSQTISGRTPLYIAELNDHKSVVELLKANLCGTK
ncbi:uncharacterized protein LOC135707425 isoform X2 [Ochlerotatus camptorhynchus]|uniref:uncharacterized protein LOC135707425 isoform X2 n=1 Tax=Ochlerotatus camptorhynchus TaxID=644619 RepID=UPI0031D45C32